MHNPQESLKWSLVYSRNAGADLYGYKILPPTLIDGLKADLDPTAVDAAQAFAAGFAPIHLPAYEGPKRDKRARRQEDRRLAGPPDRRRRVNG